MDTTAKEMAKALLEIVSSTHFDKEEILGHKLTLSQAYCLLWRDAKTGDVCGRMCGNETNGGAAAAVLVDLVVLGKAEVEVIPNTKSSVINDLILFKVLSTQPTDTYLDVAIFNKILKHYNEHLKRPNHVRDWIYEDINQNDPNQRCATISLDSLMEQGILERRIMFCGRRKYPTANPAVAEALVKEIREVALNESKPSSYIRALLTLTRTADYLTCLCDIILKKYFSQEEYGKAKQTIDELVGLDRKTKQ